MTANTPLAIWERVLSPADGGMTAETARYVLQLDFSPADHARMDDLNAQAQLGALSPAEREELDGYVRVGHKLALLQSQARAALRQLATVPARGG
jgi:hypothetical protein